MKNKIIAASLISFSLYACSQNQKAEEKKAEPQTQITETENKHKTLGEAFNSDEAIALSTLLTNMESSDSLEATIEVEVLEVCQAKGCWMKAQLPNGEEMRITFKDYGFFVPKDLAGNSVKIKGIAKNETSSVEELRHFAKDAGKTDEEIAQITEPKMDYKFIASGVQILDEEK